MRRRLVSLLLVLAAVTATTAGCIVVPVPARRVYAPPPVVYAPRPCAWVWVWHHWECR